MTGYTDLKLHIDGEWIARRQPPHAPGHQPGDGATLGELPLVDTADLDRALRQRIAVTVSGRRRTAEERGRVLKGAANLMRERVDHIARVATLEEGKTLARDPGRGAGRRQPVRILRRGMPSDVRTGVGAPDRDALHGGQGAGRPGRRLRAVEFPDRQSRPQARGADRRRLLGDSEARRRSPGVGDRSRSRAPGCGTAGRACANSSSACRTRCRATCWLRRSSASCRSPDRPRSASI